MDKPDATFYIHDKKTNSQRVVVKYEDITVRFKLYKDPEGWSAIQMFHLSNQCPFGCQNMQMHSSCPRKENDVHELFLQLMDLPVFRLRALYEFSDLYVAGGEDGQ